MEAKAVTNNLNCLPIPINEYIECPTCDAKLSKTEVARHCEEEMERLRQQEGLVQEIPDNESENEQKRRKSRNVFNRVRTNRQSRMRLRNRKRIAPSPPTSSNSNSDLHACPVCNGQFSAQDIQRHAENCLRRSNGNDSSPEDDEDSGGEEYEEYEWAGQKRIRVSSLIQGGYAALGIGQSLNGSTNGLTNGTEDEEEEDLNVDEDDTQYGPAQYAENDVIAPGGSEETNDEANVTNYMRSLITGADAANSNSKHIPLTCPEDVVTTTTASSSHKVVSVPNDMAAAQEIIESLKAKLHHYENQVQSKFKCLICLDDYRNPAISVACWHVHCERCWLQQLGAKKLCPQCNLITSPKDLRRIYM